MYHNSINKSERIGLQLLLVTSEPQPSAGLQPGARQRMEDRFEWVTSEGVKTTTSRNMLTSSNSNMCLNVKDKTRIPTDYPSANYPFWWFGVLTFGGTRPIQILRVYTSPHDQEPWVEQPWGFLPSDG